MLVNAAKEVTRKSVPRRIPTSSKWSHRVIRAGLRRETREEAVEKGDDHESGRESLRQKSEKTSTSAPETHDVDNSEGAKVVCKEVG